MWPHLFAGCIFWFFFYSGHLKNDLQQIAMGITYVKERVMELSWGLPQIANVSNEEEIGTAVGFPLNVPLEQCEPMAQEGQLNAMLEDKSSEVAASKLKPLNCHVLEDVWFRYIDLCKDHQFPPLNQYIEDVVDEQPKLVAAEDRRLVDNVDNGMCEIRQPKRKVFLVLYLCCGIMLAYLFYICVRSMWHKLMRGRQVVANAKEALDNNDDNGNAQRDDAEGIQRFLDRLNGACPEDPHWLPQDRNDLPYGKGYSLIVEQWTRRIDKRSGDGVQQASEVSVETRNTFTFKTRHLDNADSLKSIESDESAKSDNSLPEADEKLLDQKADKDIDARQEQLLLDIDSLDDSMRGMKLSDDSVANKQPDANLVSLEDHIHETEEDLQNIREIFANQTNKSFRTEPTAEDAANEDQINSKSILRPPKLKISNAFSTSSIMETEKNKIPTEGALQARELYFNESFAPSSETDQEGGTASHNLAEDRSSETTKQPDDKKTAELEQLETVNPNVEMDEEQLKQVLQMYLAIVDHSVDEMPVHEQTNGNQATGPEFTDSDLQSMDDYVDRIMKVYQVPDRVTETGENVASSLAAHDKELQSSQGEREDDLIAFPVSECSKTVVKKEMKRFSYKAPELSEFKVSAKRSKKYDESDKSPKAVHNSKRKNEVINPRASTSSEIVETPIRKRKHFKPAPAAFKKVNDRKDSNYSSSSNLPSGVAKKKDSNSSVESDGLKTHNDAIEKADENSDPNSPGNGNEIVEVIYYNPNGVEVVINCAVVSEH